MSLSYGVFEDLDFFLALPIVSKNSIDIHDHDTLGRKERATGFGDLRTGIVYRFWRKYIETAFLGGIKFPTGKTNARRDSGDKFAAELQPGSGSWDGEFGLAVSRSFRNRFSFATSFQYGLKGEGGQDHKMGDVFRYNAGGSFSMRLLGESPNLSLILELNNEWALKDHSREADRVFDSGGTTVFISPGVQVRATKNLSFFWSAPIPIYQNLGGEHEELKFETNAGASFYF